MNFHFWDNTLQLNHCSENFFTACINWIFLTSCTCFTKAHGHDLQESEIQTAIHTVDSRRSCPCALGETRTGSKNSVHICCKRNCFRYSSHVSEEWFKFWSWSYHKDSEKKKTFYKETIILKQNRLIINCIGEKKVCQINSKFIFWNEWTSTKALLQNLSL